MEKWSWSRFIGMPEREKANGPLEVWTLEEERGQYRLSHDRRRDRGQRKTRQTPDGMDGQH